MRLSLIVLLKRTGSCSTYPIKFLKYCKSYLRISIPSNNISPPVISYNLSIRFTTVVFPHPDWPINAIFFPASKLRFIPYLLL